MGKGNTFIKIIALIICFLAIGIACFYAGKTWSIVKNRNEVEGNNVSNAATRIVFDGKGAYEISCQGNGSFWVTTDSTQKAITFSYIPSMLSKYYDLGWEDAVDDVQADSVRFDKKVVDLYLGGMGQTSRGDTLFILLEDGTVEYIPIVKMFSNFDMKVSSYGQISNVANVVKFVTASASSGVTTLAIKNDGTYYDLQQVLAN